MFEFVSKKVVSLARNEIEEVIHKVQDYLREINILTFQYNLVGSASNRRHLVTRIKVVIKVLIWIIISLFNDLITSMMMQKP